MIRVLVVDDHPAVGTGTKAIIEKQEDMKADFVENSNDALEKVQQEKYDVYLVDLYMPDQTGIKLAKEIRHIDSEAVIVIYTGFDISTHYNMLLDGDVSGFVSKTATAEQLITGIRCALRGEVIIPLQLLKQLRRVEAVLPTTEDQQALADLSFTEREQQILDRVAKGMTNKVIATDIAMSQRAVEYHLTKVFSKLGVESRTEAVIKAQQYGLISVQTIEKE